MTEVFCYTLTPTVRIRNSWGFLLTSEETVVLSGVKPEAGGALSPAPNLQIHIKNGTK